MAAPRVVNWFVSLQNHLLCLLLRGRFTSSLTPDFPTICPIIVEKPSAQFYLLLCFFRLTGMPPTGSTPRGSPTKIPRMGHGQVTCNCGTVFPNLEILEQHAKAVHPENTMLVRARFFDLKLIPHKNIYVARGSSFHLENVQFQRKTRFFFRSIAPEK